MSALFSAKREDGRAEWRVIFDYVENLEYGTQVTFDEFMTLLGTEDKTRVYQAVGSAKRKLWAKAQRSLDVVRGVGYRVLQPEEHELQAGGYQRTARRRLNNAVAVMQATDISRMEPKARDWVLQVTAGMVLMARSIDDHQRRLAKHEDLIAELAKRITKLEKE
jgi:hypothetical protein